MPTAMLTPDGLGALLRELDHISTTRMIEGRPLPLLSPPSLRRAAPPRRAGTSRSPVLAGRVAAVEAQRALGGRQCMSSSSRAAGRGRHVDHRVARRALGRRARRTCAARRCDRRRRRAASPLRRPSGEQSLDALRLAPEARGSAPPAWRRPDARGRWDERRCDSARQRPAAARRRGAVGAAI